MFSDKQANGWAPQQPRLWLGLSERKPNIQFSVVLVSERLSMDSQSIITPVKNQNRRTVPLKVKLDVLKDHDIGISRKYLLNKYNLKKTTLYWIITQKEHIRKLAQENVSSESMNNIYCDQGLAPGDIDEAVFNWYKEQKASGASVYGTDLQETAEKLAPDLGHKDFKVNSDWLFKFRKRYGIVMADVADRPPTTSNPEAVSPPTAPTTLITVANVNCNSNAAGTPGVKVKKCLRIQDEITAFNRLQAGETATQIGRDLGVSKATIQRVKKQFKKNPLTSSINEKYQVTIEAVKPKVPPVKQKHGALSLKSGESVTEEFGVTESGIWRHSEGKTNASVPIRNGEKNKFSVPNRNFVSIKPRFLSEEDKAKAMQQYKAGTSLAQIARNFNVHVSTIKRLKKKLIGVQKKKSKKVVHVKNKEKILEGHNGETSTEKFISIQKRRARKFVQLEDKVKMLERLDEGDTPLEIALDLGIHESTVRKAKKNRSKIMTIFSAQRSSMKTTGAHVTMYEILEKKLLAWINDLRLRKIPVSATMIQKQAMRIQMRMSQEVGTSCQSFIPTKEWLAGFKKRHNIQKQIPYEEGETASDQVSEKERIKNSGPNLKRENCENFGGVADSFPDVPKKTASPHKGKLMLSKLAQEVREVYLSWGQPFNPYKCNAMSPRVNLVKLNPQVIKKYTMVDIVKREPACDDSEEVWSVPDTYLACDLESEGQNLLEPLVQISEKPKDKPKSNKENYNRSEFLDLSIKQEQVDSVAQMSPNVPMAVLPAGSGYVPPLPMLQMPSSGLTVFMPQHQSMLMQNTMDYSFCDSDNLQMDQQQKRSNSVHSNTSSKVSENMHSEIDLQSNIEETVTENVIVMPFGENLADERNSEHSSSEPDVTCDSEIAKKNRAAAIAENIELTAVGSSHKTLRDLTFKLLELNTKNLQYDDRIEKLREEFERQVAYVEGEKKINEKEIDKVLNAIQDWKEARGQSRREKQQEEENMNAPHILSSQLL